MPSPGIESRSTGSELGMLFTRPAQIADQITEIQRINHKITTTEY